MLDQSGEAKIMHVSAILLAGGQGVRMGAALPKQFLPLGDRRIALYSLEVLLQLDEVEEVIVVCAPEYRPFFAQAPVKFALPGPQRQDSVMNGLREVKKSAEWVCVHDSARPFITQAMVEKLFRAGEQTGNATLAVPVKNTLKESSSAGMVKTTVDRSHIWEVQTPQLLKKEVMESGFALVHQNNLSVTDDVSLAELVGSPVKLVRGGYQNIKITTPEDLLFAEWIIQNIDYKNIECASPTMGQDSAAGKSSPMASLSKV